MEKLPVKPPAALNRAERSLYNKIRFGQMRCWQYPYSAALRSRLDSLISSPEGVSLIRKLEVPT